MGIGKVQIGKGSIRKSEVIKVYIGSNIISTENDVYLGTGKVQIGKERIRKVK